MEDNKKDKIVAVTMNGLAKYESGKIEKSDYFSFIKHNLDDYSHVQFTPQEAAKLQNYMQKLSTGAYALAPMLCTGPLCPMAHVCPLQQIGKAPIGKSCLIESQLINNFVIQYMQEYDVDPMNRTEVGYCNEMAEIEIMLMRLNVSLAKPEHSTLIIDQAVGIDHEGNQILRKELSPFMEQKEKLYNRRSKIIKLMVGDRQEKYKKEAALKIREAADPSSRMADMRKQIESLQRNLNKIEGSLEEPKQQQIKDPQKILTPDDLINDTE